VWLVLEGIDGAGKTTLADKLQKADPRYSVLHVGPPGKTSTQWVPSTEIQVGGSFIELAKYWSGDARDAKFVIWDRGHLGNWVYQAGLDRMTVGEMRLLEALLMDHNGVTVLLNTDVRIAFGRHSGDRTLEDLQRESIAFQQALHDLKSYWITTDVRGLKTLFADWQKYDTVKHMDTEGVGSNTPEYWILGEQRNPKAEIQVPFSSVSGMRLIWPWVNPMTMRLSNALRPEADLARARDGLFSGETLSDLYFRWATLGKPRVVALGHTAQAACVAAGVKVSLSTEHPQHVWRFRQEEADAWRERVAMKVGMIA
jgi:hypothetical protein